jgi:hypothetical protein
MTQNRYRSLKLRQRSGRAALSVQAIRHRAFSGESPIALTTVDAFSYVATSMNRAVLYARVSSKDQERGLLYPGPA